MQVNIQLTEKLGRVISTFIERTQHPSIIKPTYLVLATDIPNSKANVLVLHSFHIKSWPNNKSFQVQRRIALLHRNKQEENSNTITWMVHNLEKRYFTQQSTLQLAMTTFEEVLINSLQIMCMSRESFTLLATTTQFLTEHKKKKKIFYLLYLSRECFKVCVSTIWSLE